MAADARQGAPPRRVLLVNLDFQDVVYSYLWGRAVIDGCAQLDSIVDMVTVNPFAGRDLAAELGVARSALDPHINGTAVYLDRPDQAKYQSVIGQLLDRHRYFMIILNCDAALFIHLMVERERNFADTQWLIYDRHLHIDLRAHDHDAHLRDRIAASYVHLYTIEEISSGGVSFGPEHAIVPNEETNVASFKRLGLTVDRIHFQQWPLDDEFFAPRPDAARADSFVIFSGGDSGRDYATLFEAIQGLPLQLRLCANNYPQPLPANVTILPRLALHEFRDEVARATAVVVPLTGEPVVSGITVIAMAKMMGKPVIASDNRVVRLHIRSQGEGGYLTQTGNPTLLRGLLTLLIESPAERERLAREARAQAVRDLSLKAFVQRMLNLQ